MEGYLFDRDDAKQRLPHGGRRGPRRRPAGVADPVGFVLRRSSPRRLPGLVADQVDLLFGNEDELCALYEVATFDDAVAALRRDGTMGAITRGKDGSVVITADEVIDVAAEPVDPRRRHHRRRRSLCRRLPLRLTHGRSLAECGRLGSIAAAEVIAHVGPRPLVELRRLVRPGRPVRGPLAPVARPR